jgi:NTP pyrophosphatase (non-canonical NTP hydrolase)
VDSTESKQVVPRMVNEFNYENMVMVKEFIRVGINRATERSHGDAVKAGWWTNLKTGESTIGTRNKGEMLMLMVSEIAEAMEGERKNLMDEKLPHRKAAEVELADCLIRIFDYAGAYGYDLGGAVIEKLEYNRRRADHKPENRVKEGGKSF